MSSGAEEGIDVPVAPALARHRSAQPVDDDGPGLRAGEVVLEEEAETSRRRRSCSVLEEEPEAVDLVRLEIPAVDRDRADTGEEHAWLDVVETGCGAVDQHALVPPERPSEVQAALDRRHLVRRGVIERREERLGDPHDGQEATADRPMAIVHQRRAGGHRGVHVVPPVHAAKRCPGRSSQLNPVGRNTPTVSDRPVIEARHRRLVAFLRYNRDQLVVDAAILLTWIVVSAVVFRWLDLPQWLHYVVLFVGIYVYAKITPEWDRPYRGPD